MTLLLLKIVFEFHETPLCPVLGFLVTLLFPKTVFEPQESSLYSIDAAAVGLLMILPFLKAVLEFFPVFVAVLGLVILLLFEHQETLLCSILSHFALA